MLVFLQGWDDITQLHQSLGQLPQASLVWMGGWVGLGGGGWYDGRIDSSILNHNTHHTPHAGVALAAVPAALAAADGPAARHIPAAALGPAQGTVGWMVW